MLYGTTGEGGPYNVGTIYKIGLNGAFTSLYTFGPYPYATGSDPFAALVEGNDGNFYGTTVFGGANNDGTLFRVTSNGALTTLHSFDNTDGAEPYGALILGTDGKFYGTTAKGGANGVGTIFRYASTGTLTTLHSFDNTDGSYPESGLVQGTDGNFYGTTYSGGTYLDCADQSCGTVYRLSLGLGPFVKTVPAFGKAGAAVTILGTDLTGATSVTFNGIAAAFTVLSPTAISTSVPSGAASGKIQVATPNGTLVSTVAFQVL
jgi:uncharacterized repeat protein (TIGR03803 family)